MFPKYKDKVQIHLFRIKNKGSHDYNIVLEQKLEPITMNHPKNRFQAQILKTYNECRTQALHKYFPMLSESDIKQLLNDNYLQKDDLIKILYK
jgi:ribosomal protein L15